MQQLMFFEELASLLHFGINYTNHLSVFEYKYTKILTKTAGDLKLTLVKRKGAKIDPKTWTKEKKGYIAS